MNKYTFTTRQANQNIYASHINDLQTAVNEISTELVDGISNTTGIKFSGTSGAITLKSVSGTVTGTIYIPSTSTTDTLVGQNTTDTLKNKTINTADNTIQVGGASVGATAQSFRTTILPPQSGANLKYLRSNGTDVTWELASAVGSLNDLSDAAVASPILGQTLVYNGTSEFVNSYITGSFTVILGDGVNAITAGAGSYQTVMVFVPYDHTITDYSIWHPNGVTANNHTVTVNVRSQPLANVTTSTNITTRMSPALSTSAISTVTGQTIDVSSCVYLFEVTVNSSGATKIAIMVKFRRREA